MFLPTWLQLDYHHRFRLSLVAPSSGRCPRQRLATPPRATALRPALSKRVLSVYSDLGDRCTMESKENPIAKLPLGVTGINLQLIVDVIMQDT